ncbi:MAG: asparagine synthase (glutamine-hydrolyzing) [Acidobacteria bacterium]|nr:asparagine synthase (glutamine-hydrolyzing) [Acidobacteriota bacterium]
MCGICGEVRFGGGRVSPDDIVRMRENLVHRGPDSAGLFVSGDRRAGLGFRRLRVIDLSPEADQPMPNEDGSVQLVFNGEIYNFVELRRELEQKGHRFRSRSDSEVIVHLYEEEGAAGVSRLDGMFALAIWDARVKRMVLARDRAGKKPLFYSQTREGLIFASEMKSFFTRQDYPMEVDPATVPQYFIHGYVPSPRTFYRNVSQLEPATIMTVDAGGHVVREVYWRPQFRDASSASSAPVSDEQAANGVRQLMTKAVERRLISDVPLGAFLSGGVDSTIVVGLMSRLMSSPVRTFSIGFEGDPRFDETAYAREVAERFKTDHTEFRVTPSAIDLIDKLIWHHDGPFGDASAIPTYIVSQLTRQSVTVVLNGDGGDELFAGYQRFAAAVLAERMPSFIKRPLQGALEVLPFSTDEKHWLSRGRRFLQAMNLPLNERMTRWSGLFYDDLELLLAPDLVSSLAAIDRLQYLEAERKQMRGLSTLGAVLHANFRSYLLDDLLVKVDRCSMANSLEARSPFLDTALVEYVGGLPDSMKLRGLKTKFILRKAFEDLLPRSVARRGKMGFGVPLGTWFRTELKDYIRDLLLDSSARYKTFLSATYVHGLVTRHQAGGANSGLQLWSVLCFELWLRSLPQWKGRFAPDPAGVA